MSPGRRPQPGSRTDEFAPGVDEMVKRGGQRPRVRYRSVTFAGRRPRSLTAMPWLFAQARISPLRCRLATVRVGRLTPRPVRRAGSMKGGSWGRDGLAFLLVRAVS